MIPQPPPPPPAPQVHPLVIIILIIMGAVLFLGSVMSYANPHANFPVISQVICSLRGATWYDGGILGEPGCYSSTAG